MKKSGIILAVLFIAASLAFGQVSVNPSDDFYTDAQNWEIEGIVENLPPLRPYSLNCIKTILNEVMEKGSENDVTRAELYYQQIFGKKWKVKAEADVKAKISNDSETENLTFSKNLLGYPSLEGDLSLFNDLASVGYKIGFNGRTAGESDFLPLYEKTSHDSLFDAAVIGPFYTYVDSDDAVSVGTDKVFFQAGVNRSGYGSFLGSGIAINESNYHAGNLGFTYMADNWNYTQQFSVIGATDNTGTSTVYPEKFLAFHGFEAYFLKNFHVSYYEAMVFGNRFDPAYFVPAPYMVVQGLNGYSDNLLMGLIFDWTIRPGLLYSADFFVDDLSVNDLVKFNFDTRIRMAGKTGIVWVPETPVVSRVECNFTAVMPFMYGHCETDSSSSYSAYVKNYENYTNCGQQMGSSLPPDSGEISLKTVLNPAERLKLTVYGNFIAHGNAAEDFTENEALTFLKAAAGTYSSDGSVYTHSQYSGGLIEASEKWRWLTQEHKMYVFQAGTSGEYSFKEYKWGKIALTFGYDFEYIKNKGVDSDIWECCSLKANDDGTYTIGGNTYTASEVVALYRQEWIEGFHDVLSHYLSFGLKYQF